jgi:hypothetical protein
MMKKKNCYNVKKKNKNLISYRNKQNNSKKNDRFTSDNITIICPKIPLEKIKLVLIATML